jgi:hypothetical protein
MDGNIRDFLAGGSDLWTCGIAVLTELERIGNASGSRRSRMGDPGVKVGQRGTVRVPQASREAVQAAE